jgi:3-oxoacyl-[acyl-carrier-protein] synthase-3
MPSILGFGAYVPERVVSHLELAAQLGVEPDWILQVCGIRERRYAGPGETVEDLAERAARACLARLGMAPGEIGAVIVGSGTPTRMFPGISASLQQRLGISGGPAFDIHLASAGGLMAIATAGDLCARYGPILVVAAEHMSPVVQGHPAKETTILFGDGAGACVVAPGPGRLLMEDWRMGSDGAFADDLCLAPGGPLVMNGRAVIMQANKKLHASVNALLAQTGVRLADIDLFLFHQANLVLLKQVAKGLGIAEERLFFNLERYGNTSSASLLIAAAEAMEAGRMAPGSRILMAAFGAGFSYGSLLLRGN